MSNKRDKIIYIMFFLTTQIKLKVEDLLKDIVTTNDLDMPYVFISIWQKKKKKKATLCKALLSQDFVLFLDPQLKFPCF